VARALANDPMVVLADEPTGNLDTASGEEVLALFDRLHAERHVTPILVTHSPEIGRRTRRLIRLREGKQVVYLVTDVLDRGRQTVAQARRLYRARWGAEVFFRSYKQTLARRRLLSRTPATCLAESQWTLLGLWLLGLMSVRGIAARGGDPKTWSVAGSRDLVRQALRGERPRGCGRQPLPELLARAVRDTYERQGDKAARNYPRKKKHKPPGPPKVEPAKPAEIKRAARLQPQMIKRKCAA